MTFLDCKSNGLEVMWLQQPESKYYLLEMIKVADNVGDMEEKVFFSKIIFWRMVTISNRETIEDEPLTKLEKSWLIPLEFAVTKDVGLEDISVSELRPPVVCIDYKLRKYKYSKLRQDNTKISDRTTVWTEPAV